MRTTKKLILASQSERRADLLKQIGIDFKIIPSEFDENSISKTHIEPKEYVQTLALKKAEFLSCQGMNDALILSADTIVVIEGQILGKPINKEQAYTYLKLLSGKIHEVYTGVCILDPKNSKKIVRYQCTTVLMDTMNEHDFDYYIGTKEPFDKAGAYGIQGIGARYIKKINGDYFNIVGLPINLTIHMLKEMNYIL
jgi:septum formation protein